jgi:hypothetical protein
MNAMVSPLAVGAGIAILVEIVKPAEGPMRSCLASALREAQQVSTWGRGLIRQEGEGGGVYNINQKSGITWLGHGET